MYCVHLNFIFQQIVDFESSELQKEKKWEEREPCYNISSTIKI